MTNATTPQADDDTATGSGSEMGDLPTYGCYSDSPDPQLCVCGMEVINGFHGFAPGHKLEGKIGKADGAVYHDLTFSKTNQNREGTKP